MQCFFMRHGDALWNAQNDAERSLSSIGRMQTEQMAKRLFQELKNVDLVLISPYLRAEQTWEELVCFGIKPKYKFNLTDLVPSANPSHTLNVILAYAEQYQAQKVLVISHMPLLSYLVAEIVRGEDAPIFSTSAVCSVEINDGYGHMIDYQTPKLITESLVS